LLGRIKDYVVFQNQGDFGMNAKLNLRKAAELGIGLVAITALVLAGCGGGGGGGSSNQVVNPPVDPVVPTAAVRITPFKGPFTQGSTVTLKDANGNPVTLITGGTIGADGVANMTISTTVTYPLLVEVSGTYFNELTGQPETASEPLRSLITDVTAASNVPVTIVTETAVADLQNSIGGGNFSSANPIRAASAVAALDLAGSNLGIPAAAIPVFNHATNQTSDDNTIRLAALAVVANSQGTGTLANKVKTLAHNMATLNAASSPADVVSQAAFDAAISNMTSGASSVAAAGVTPPAAPTIRAITLSDLAGTWNRHRLQAGRTNFDVNGAPISTTANWNHGTEIYDGLGNGQCGPEWINSGSAVASTAACSPYVVSISATGVIAEVGNQTEHATMSASKDLIVATRTAGNGFDPRLIILQKQIPGVTFAPADLAGNWSRHILFSGRTWADATPNSTNSRWERGVETWATDGSATEIGTAVRSDGNPTTPNAIYSPFSIATDGTVTVPLDPTVHGTMSASKDLVVVTKTAGNGVDVMVVIFQKQTTNFVMSDLAGTWNRHILRVGRTSALDGTSSNRWEHGLEKWASDGSATEIGTGVRSDGVTTPPGTVYYPFSIATDGTVTVPLDPTVHGTMSASKDLVVVTKTAGNGVDVMAVIFQKMR